MISITINVLFLIKLYLFGAILALFVGAVSCCIFKPKDVTRKDWILLALLSYFGVFILVDGLAHNFLKRRGR